MQEFARCKFSRFCYVVAVGNCCCVCIIFKLSVQSLKLLTVDFHVVPQFWMCGAVTPCHIWTSKARCLGSETYIYIYIVQDIGSVGYRRPEKQCVLFFILAGDWTQCRSITVQSVGQDTSICSKVHLLWFTKDISRNAWNCNIVSVCGLPWMSHQRVFTHGICPRLPKLRQLAKIFVFH